MAKRIVNFEPEYDKLLKNCDELSVEQPDETFRRYYYLYEYTDEIDVICDNPQYPSILNYVKTGLLTPKEMVEALTYGKKAL